MIDVIGIGALNLDFIYEVEDIAYVKVPGLEIEEGKEIVAQEEHLSALKDKFNRFGILRKVSPGGSASNTCHMLALMGNRVGMIGILGDDREGDFYLKQLLHENVQGIIRKGKTGLAYIINAASKDRSIVVFPNSNSDVDEKVWNMGLLAHTKWVHMSSFVSDKALAMQIDMKNFLVDTTRVSIDPGEIYAKMGEKAHPLLEGIEILFTSERELTMLFGIDMEEALRKALSMAKIVVVKRGKQGASVFTKEESHHTKARKVEVVDNTGAGDVFNGVFIGCYMNNMKLSQIIHTATAAASMSTQGFGRDGYPRKNDIALLEKG